jgi:hypothetical protein
MLYNTSFGALREWVTMRLNPKTLIVSNVTEIAWWWRENNSCKLFPVVVAVAVVVLAVRLEDEGGMTEAFKCSKKT